MEQIAAVTMYQYSDLPRGHTRVLEYVTTNLNTDPLAFKVKEIDLFGAYPPYIALSYAWRDERKFDHEIFCDDQPVQITGTLHSMLRRIRELLDDGDKSSWNTIWVDAISISQTRSAEKGQQVSMMHEIFSRATEVVVCLGETAFDDELKAWFAEDVEPFYKRADVVKSVYGLGSDAYQLELAVEHRGALKLDENVPQLTAILPEAAKDAKYIDRILKDPWFTRCWCIQEFVLAKSVRFLIGRTTIDRVQFHGKILGDPNQINQLNFKTDDAVLIYSDVEAQCNRDNFTLVSRLRAHTMSVKSMKMPFSAACSITSPFDSTVQLDFIYSLNALTDFGGEPLEINYTQTPSQLGGEVARRLRRNGCCEEILHMAVGVKSTSDTTTSWHTQLKKEIRLQTSDNMIGAGIEVPFYAGGKSKTQRFVECSLPEHPSCLKIPGFVVDTLVRISEPYPSIDAKKPGSNLFPRLKYNSEKAVVFSNVALYMFADRVRTFLKKTPGFEDVSMSSQVIWEQLLLHNHRLTKEEWDRIGQSTSGILENDLLMYQDEDRVHDQSLPWGEALTLVENRVVWLMEQIMLGKMVDMLNNPRAWRKPIQDAFPPGTQLSFMLMVDRCFASTQANRVGTVKQTAQPGDVVMLFQGCRFPFIMRPWDNGTYRIVGSANIHGIMFGEAEPTEWQEIHIV